MSLESLNTIEKTRLFPGFSRTKPPRDAAIRLDENSWVRDGSSLWTEPTPALIEQVVQHLWGAENPARFVLVYNAVPTLVQAAGMDFDEAVTAVRSFRRNLCDAVYVQFTERFPDIINPTRMALEPLEGALDGFGPNVNPYNPGVEHFSTKQLHFDNTEPLGSNLYGPNKNVSGGLPVFADALAYCQQNNVSITDTLEKIRGERILTLKAPHYRSVLEDFSVAFEVDMVRDTPFSIILGRVVEAGVMHGATFCEKSVANEEVKRPIVHYEYVDLSPEASDAWFAALGQTNSRAPGQPGQKPIVPVDLHPSRTPLVIVPK